MLDVNPLAIVKNNNIPYNFFKSLATALLWL
jgi:hypothetical protein